MSPFIFLSLIFCFHFHPFQLKLINFRENKSIIFRIFENVKKLFPFFPKKNITFLTSFSSSFQHNYLPRVFHLPNNNIDRITVLEKENRKYVCRKIFLCVENQIYVGPTCVSGIPLQNREEHLNLNKWERVYLRESMSLALLSSFMYKYHIRYLYNNLCLLFTYNFG